MIAHVKFCVINKENHDCTAQITYKNCFLSFITNIKLEKQIKLSTYNQSILYDDS